MKALVILSMTAPDVPLYASSLDRVGCISPATPWFVT